MITAGYRFDNANVCRGCRQQIEWWFTPNGRKIPMDPMPNETSAAVSHFGTCPKANSFRKAG